MARLRASTSRAIEQLTRATSVASEISQEVVKLSTHLCQYQTNQSEGLEALATYLLQISKERNELLSSLAVQRESEEGWWKAREKKMTDTLALKAVSFFQMGFEGAVKQFSAQGYPPLGEYSAFIDCAAALGEFPSDVFNMMFQDYLSSILLSKKYLFATVC